MGATLEYLVVRIIVRLLGIIIVGCCLQLLVARIVCVCVCVAIRLTRWAINSLIVLCAFDGRDGFHLNVAAAAADVMMYLGRRRCYPKENKLN